MRVKPDATLRSEPVLASSTIDYLLRDLTSTELERLTIYVIEEHRKRLQIAQDLFDELERLEAASLEESKFEQLAHDYRVAQLNLHGQHQLVSLLISRLGYVPLVEGQLPALN